jgi:hypothetical protein
VSWLREPVISSRVNCGHEDHAAPRRFLHDVLLGRVNDFVVWACRSGSKSYLAGLITWIDSSFRPGLETTILGGSLEQSEKVYKAMDSFWAMSGLQDDYLLEEPTRRATAWLNGSIASVLTASPKSVRGPHPQRLLMDEIDEMDEAVYKAALSQPQSKRGIAASIGKLSTNHRYFGVMDSAVEQARAQSIALYKWCIWDVLKSCRDYTCSTCQLSRFCPGEQMRLADGYYEPSDFAQKLRELALVTLQIEWFCDKVGRSDLVYGEQFDEALHSPAWLPDFNPDEKVLLSIDWGGTVFSCGVWQPFEIGWVRVDEVYVKNSTNQRCLAECRARPWWSNVAAAVSDPSGKAFIQEWREAGVPMVQADNEVQPGIDATRNALLPVIGQPRFYVSRRCRAWAMEVMSYREKNGKPVKENDHAMDETRYFVKWMIASKAKRKGGVYHLRSRKPGDEEQGEKRARAWFSPEPVEVGQGEAANPATPTNSAENQANSAPVSRNHENPPNPAENQANSRDLAGLSVPAAGGQAGQPSAPILAIRPEQASAGQAGQPSASPGIDLPPQIPQGVFHVQRKGRVFCRR